MYVLRTNEDSQSKLYYSYYTGYTYRFRREWYAVVDHDVEKAKVYSSRKRAINAMESLNNKCVNYLFEVGELAS